MFPIKEVLSGPYLYDDYKPELMDMVLKKLDADSIRLDTSLQCFTKYLICLFNCPKVIILPYYYYFYYYYRVYVIGKKFEDQANLTEKWYGTKYSIEQIPEEQIKVEHVYNVFIT